MELATVMPSAPMTSNGSMELLTLKDGTKVLASTVHAALSLIFGKQIHKLLPTQLILATSLALRDVKAPNVEMELTDTMESAIRTAVTSTHTEWVTRISSELAQTSRLTPTSHSH